MPWTEILRLSWDSQECRIPNAVTYANGQVVLWPSLVQQAPSYPAALHTEFVCPAVYPATKNPALESLKSNSALVLGQEFWLFHQVQCLMMFLVNVTQLVEYPLFLSHIILYFLTLKISLGYQSVQAGGLLDSSEFWSCHSTHTVVCHLSLCLPSWAPRYLLSVSILACPGQLFSLLPWRPGLWNHHSLLQPWGSECSWLWLYSHYLHIKCILFPASYLGFCPCPSLHSKSV